MRCFFKLAFILVLLFGACALPAEEMLVKPHSGFLIRSKEYAKAIDQYKSYKANTKSHDFELLEEMALALLHQGVQSRDEEEQLLSLYGASLCATALPVSFLDSCIASDNILTQIASLRLIAMMQDSHCDSLLTKAMSSMHFASRIEAAQILASRKTKNSVGQIESLMYKIPDPFRFLFANFFGQIGTGEAITVLKQLMQSPYHQNRTSAILAAAQFGRDDLLPDIRAIGTQINPAEQEACAAAIGILKDHKSLKLLQKLAKSPSDQVKLAALKSLTLLGVMEAKQEIIELAKKENLFAIRALGEVDAYDEVLKEQIKSENLTLKFNSTVALLSLRNPACFQPLMTFIIRDHRDLGFIPSYSLGFSLNAWKVFPSATQHQEIEGYDIQGYSLYVRELLLRDCLELPEDTFLEVVKTLFNSRQKDLVPLAIELLLQKGSEKAIKVLETYSQMVGAPLVRAYCHLALYKLNKGELYRNYIKDWIRHQKALDIIQLRGPLSTKEKPIVKSFELSSDESSSFLVHSCLMVAEKQEEDGLDLFLDLIRDGNPKNRALLAGILLRALH